MKTVSAEERAKKVDAIKTRMAASRGALSDTWSQACEAAPEFMECYENLYQTCLMDGEHLPAKYRELAALGIICFRMEQPSITAHVLRCLRLGLKKGEILDAIETTIIPGGAPTFSCGLVNALKAFKIYDEEVANK